MRYYADHKDMGGTKAVKRLNDFLHPEPNFKNMPIKQVKAELKANGIDPKPLIKKIKRMVKKEKPVLKDLKLPFENKKKAADIYGNDYRKDDYRCVSVNVHHVKSVEKDETDLSNGVKCETVYVTTERGEHLELKMFKYPKEKE